MSFSRRTLAVAAFAALVVALNASGAPSRAAGSPADEQTIFVLSPVARDVGNSIAHAPQADHSRESARREIPLRLAPGGVPGRPGRGGGSPDGALQTTATTPAATIAGSVNVDGVGVGITPTYRDCCTPPDTNLAVGTTQVVQWVNLDVAAFDKGTGALLAGYPKAGNSIWSGFGTGCEANNHGDPIVKFDAQNARWIMTQFSVSTSPYLVCVAVSATDDFTTTSWHRYAYDFGADFPDYPKVSIWPDGYYFSFNEFRNGATFEGARACAFDGATARAGGAATMQCVQFGTGVGSLLPADLDGANGAIGATGLPPTGAAAYFMNFGSNALNQYRFHTDFANSANTTLTGPNTLATASFATACGGGTCIAQAGTSQKLDSLGDRLMYRLAYRNFGAYESLTVTHSVKGSGTAAPRWYELRDSGAGWAITQQSSYAPDTTYRWMGSAAQDKLGNLAIGYSASSTAISPQIRYAGRLAGDPLSSLRAEVTVPLPGTGSETGPYSRWGDYSSMTLDPADDCTFWYTTEYYKAFGGSFTWSTRIVNFKFPGC
jgi:hypothetical protein